MAVTARLMVSIISCVIGTAVPGGYSITVINAPQGIIQDFFQRSEVSQTGSEFSKEGLTQLWAFTVTSFFLLSPIGAIAGPRLAARFGRVPVMQANHALLLVGALLQAWASYFNAYQMFILGRAITGINVGMSTTVAPMYLCEIAPARIRGAVGTSFSISLSLGVLLGCLLPLHALLGSEGLWPELFNVLMVFAFLSSVLMTQACESPAFLFSQRGDEEKARKSLSRLRGDSVDIEWEIEQLKAVNSQSGATEAVKITDFFTQKRLRQPFILAMLVSSSQAVAGICALDSYSSPIFTAVLSPSAVQANPDLPNYFVALSGLTQLGANVAVLPLVERCGRKALMLVGLGGGAACTIAISVLLSGLVTTPGQQCEGVPQTEATELLAMILIFLYQIFFVVGPATMTWILAPELFDDSARPLAVTIGTILNWWSFAAGNYLFPVLQLHFCGWAFLPFAAGSIFMVIYFSVFLPEVKGLTIREIVAKFDPKEEDQPDERTFLNNPKAVDQPDEKSYLEEKENDNSDEKTYLQKPEETSHSMKMTCSNEREETERSVERHTSDNPVYIN